MILPKLWTECLENHIPKNELINGEYLNHVRFAHNIVLISE